MDFKVQDFSKNYIKNFYLNETYPIPLTIYNYFCFLLIIIECALGPYFICFQNSIVLKILVVIDIVLFINMIVNVIFNLKISIESNYKYQFKVNKFTKNNKENYINSNSNNNTFYNKNDSSLDSTNNNIDDSSKKLSFSNQSKNDNKKSNIINHFSNNLNNSLINYSNYNINLYNDMYYISSLDKFNKNCVFKLNRTTLKYIKYWIVFDVFTYFPFTIIYFLSYVQYYDKSKFNIYDFFGLISALKIIKLYYILNIKHILIKLIDRKIFSAQFIYNFLFLIKLLLFYSIIGHLVTCFCIRYELDKNLNNKKIFFSAIDLDVIESDIHLYLLVFYYVMVSAFTTGYGEIVPKTVEEKKLMLIFEIVLYCLHTYLLTEAISIAHNSLNESLQKRKFSNFLKSVKDNYNQTKFNSLRFFDNKGIIYDKFKASNIESMLDNLGHKYAINQLKNLIYQKPLLCKNISTSSIYSEFFIKNMLFKKINSYYNNNNNHLLLNNSIRIIPNYLNLCVFNNINYNYLCKKQNNLISIKDLIPINLIKSHFLFPGEFVIKQNNSNCNNLYLLNKGKLLAYNEETSLILGFINTRNTIFGQLGFFDIFRKNGKCNNPSIKRIRNCNIISSGFGNILKINKKNFIKKYEVYDNKNSMQTHNNLISSSLKESSNKVKVLWNKFYEYSYKKSFKDLNCFFCKSSSHIIYSCSTFYELGKSYLLNNKIQDYNNFCNNIFEYKKEYIFMFLSKDMKELFLKRILKIENNKDKFLINTLEEYIQHIIKNDI